MSEATRKAVVKAAMRWYANAYKEIVENSAPFASEKILANACARHAKSERRKK